MSSIIKILVCFGLLAVMLGGSQAAVVIQYHHVDAHTPPSTSVVPEVFAQHMAYLADNGFQVWPLPRLVNSLKQGKTLPNKVIAITFDDGYESVYSEALPILQQYHFPFTVFINTDLVGGKGYMSWQQLEAMTAQGVTISNHTVNHPHLIRHRDQETELAWQKRIRHEMVDAEDVIRKKIGSSAGLLAYPYGEYDSRVEHIARNLGLVAFAQNSAAFDQNVNWQAVPRFAFGGQYTQMSGFIDKVNSLPMPLLKVAVNDDQGQSLVEPLLPIKVSRPILTLQLKTTAVAQAIHCYASGQGRIAVEVEGDTVTARPHGDLPVGRSRINCTARSGLQGRFYWYSQFFMRKRPDGRWYDEY